MKTRSIEQSLGRCNGMVRRRRIIKKTQQGFNRRGTGFSRHPLSSARESKSGAPIGPVVATGAPDPHLPLVESTVGPGNEVGPAPFDAGAPDPHLPLVESTVGPGDEVGVRCKYAICSNDGAGPNIVDWARQAEEVSPVEARVAEPGCT